MRAQPAWCLAALLTLASGTSAQPGGKPAISPEWLHKARTEGQAAYEKYRALSLRLEEVCETRSDKAEDPGPGKGRFRPQTMRERTARLDNNRIIEQIRTLDGAPGPQYHLECDNGDYHFDLRKHAEEVPYALVDYAQGNRRLPLVNRGAGMHSASSNELGDLLDAVEGRRAMRLLALRWDQANGLLRAEYARAGDAPLRKRVVVEPSHDWRVIETWVETPHLVGTTEYSYGQKVGGLTFPTGFKDISRYKTDKAPPNFQVTGRLISLRVTDKTPADFRLSAFGLPEPVDVPPSRATPRYVWVLMAATACAVLGIGLAYVRRRRQATQGGGGSGGTSHG